LSWGCLDPDRNLCEARGKEADLDEFISREVAGFLIAVSLGPLSNAAQTLLQKQHFLQERSASDYHVQRSNSLISLEAAFVGDASR